MKAKILGTGSYVPEHRLTNHDLEKMVETNDQWIRERTGIVERRVTDKGTSYMAVEAAKAALTGSLVSAEEIDLIIVATTTPDYQFPGVACQVQEQIGAKKAACFDVSAACTGFLFALNTASAYIQSGMAETILVIGADASSKIIDWTDRSTCILFGDGAGAVVVKAADTGVLAIDMGSNGSKGSVLPCESRPLNNPIVKNTGDGGYMHMDGQEVFKFAIRTVPQTIKKVLAEAGVNKEQVRYFLLHQANQRILTAVTKALKIDAQKMPVNIDRYGNTAAASLPLLLDEMNKSGKLQRGDLLVLSAFGAGLTWGSAVLEW